MKVLCMTITVLILIRPDNSKYYECMLFSGCRRGLIKDFLNCFLDAFIVLKIFFCFLDAFIFLRFSLYFVYDSCMLVQFNNLVTEPKI